MPYLEVNKKNEEEQINMQIEMPDLTGVTVKEAKKILIDLELEYEIDTEGEDVIIKDQLPKKGIVINKGTKVILYSN